MTPGPWEYVPSTEHHGPYVCGPFGGDICDCYTMTIPGAMSVRNGGPSKPVHFQGEFADANARLIAAAPDLLDALKTARKFVVSSLEALVTGVDFDPAEHVVVKKIDAAIAKAEGAA